MMMMIFCCYTVQYIIIMCALCPCSILYNLQKETLQPSSTLSTEIRGFLLYTTRMILLRWGSIRKSLLKNWSSETEEVNFSSLTLRALKQCFILVKSKIIKHPVKTPCCFWIILQKIAYNIHMFNVVQCTLSITLKHDNIYSAE